jgi:hypothetical protein
MGRGAGQWGTYNAFLVAEMATLEPPVPLRYLTIDIEPRSVDHAS